MSKDILGYDDELEKKKGFGKSVTPEASNAAEAGLTKNQKMAAAGLALKAAKSSGVIDTSSTGGGALGGAASGALAGSAFGPVGTAVGGVVGGITGGLKARAARKKAQKQAEADMHRGLGKVAENKAERLQNAFSSLGALMRIT